MRDGLIRFDKVGFVLALLDSFEIPSVQADYEQNRYHVKWDAQELVVYHLVMFAPLIDSEQKGIIKDAK